MRELDTLLVQPSHDTPEEAILTFITMKRRQSIVREVENKLHEMVNSDT
jgi:hypothetical protein